MAKLVNSAVEKEVTYQFELPDVHPSLNRWTNMHWTAKSALKKQWENDTYYSAKEAKLPNFKCPVEIYIIYVHPRETVDIDNYTPKFVCDGLKSFFGDDNITHLKKIGWEFVKGPEKKTIVLIGKYQPLRDTNWLRDSI